MNKHFKKALLWMAEKLLCVLSLNTEAAGPAKSLKHTMIACDVACNTHCSSYGAALQSNWTTSSEERVVGKDGEE